MAQAYYHSGSTWKEWSADMVNAFPYKITTDTNLDNSKSTGLYTIKASPLTSSSGAAIPFEVYHSMILSNSDIGTPFQIAFPDGQNYIYKKINASNTWSKMNAGYADSAGSVSWNNITDKPSTYSPADHTHSYLPLSGGTLTGSVTFANCTWNVVGDDSAIGDQNIGGTLCVKGCNGTPAIKLFNSDNTQYADVYHTANTVGLCHVGSSAPSDNNTKIWIQT